VWHDSLRPIGDLHPPPFVVRPHGCVHHGLCLDSFKKRRSAGSVVDNRVDEFEVLIVTERDERIALTRIAWRTGPYEKLLGHSGSRQIAGAPPADTQLERALRAVDD